MATRRNAGEPGPTPVPHTLLPTVCVVTEDVEFLDELIPEVVPWFQVVIRPDYFRPRPLDSRSARGGGPSRHRHRRA